jgi:hypothetical protein
MLVIKMQRLFNLLPMLLMISSLAYATYLVQPMVATFPSSSGASVTKGRESSGGMSKVKGSQAMNEVPEAMRRVGRDPYHPAVKHAQVADGDLKKDSMLGRDETDSSNDLIQGLTLNATFLRGNTQMAVIDGRIYQQGQHLLNADDEPSPLFISQVVSNQVILRDRSRRYVLAYPDPLAHAEPEPPPQSPQAATGSPLAQDPGSLLTLLKTLLNVPSDDSGGGLLSPLGGILAADMRPRSRSVRPARGARPPGGITSGRSRVRPGTRGPSTTIKQSLP